MYGHLQVKLEQLSSRHCDDPYYSSVKPLGDRKLKMSYDISNNVLPFETDCKGIEVEMHVRSSSSSVKPLGDRKFTMPYDSSSKDDPYFSSVKALGDRQFTMPYGSTCIILPFETDCKGIEVEMHVRSSSSSVKPLGDRKFTMPYDSSSKVLPG
ncbi:hypothetical protein BKA69DRAFT_1129811 [Paraphysoderma sedebokerense]|nr:hypothetical protein BKA69DRAFT_1129811 [Paraphysoderma sedebokerense]